MILPPATIGILGGGQLGRMIAMAGRRMGYHFRVFEPADECPAEGVCDERIKKPYEDQEAIDQFLFGISACTLEFENIPYETATYIAERVPLSPSPEILRICQSRKNEKEFLRQYSIPVAEFAVVTNADELASSVEKIGNSSVLKSAFFGYDGKGQIKIYSNSDLDKVWMDLGVSEGVLEQWVEHHGEYSIIVARNHRGEKKAFPISENLHVNHILHTSVMPANLPPEEVLELEEIAFALVDALELEGMVAIEFFRTGSGWLVNEIAPRPHNSGHLTFDACFTSQFEQCVRASCGLPFGDTHLLQAGVMMNLMGDLWSHGEPDWAQLLKYPNLKLHLYGKKEAKPGRKMGHLCILNSDLQDALNLSRKIEEDLIFKDRSSGI